MTPSSHCLINPGEFHKAASFKKVGQEGCCSCSPGSCKFFMENIRVSTGQGKLENVMGIYAVRESRGKI